MSCREIILSVFLSVFMPKSRQPLSAWMSENIILRPEESPSKPGPYDPTYSPGPAMLFDVFTSGDWNELIVQKSSQAALSLHTLAFLTRNVSADPRNAIYVMDSDLGARKISDRLKAFIEDSPSTRSIVAEGGDQLNTLVFRLPGMNLWFTGAGSAGKLASSAVSIGVGDEVDKHGDLHGEASTLDLLRSRLKEDPSSLLIAFSTPTLTSGQIHREYLTGSRHKLHVPCPHCGELQELVWDQVRFAHCKELIGGRWDLHRLIHETFYECIACQGQILDSHKPEIIRPGRAEWRPTHFITTLDPEGNEQRVPGWDPQKLSAHYSDLYSQNPKVSWGQLAKKFVQALENPMKLRDFYQNNLGLPDQEGGGEVSEDKILALRGPYRRQREKQERMIGGADLEHEVHDPGTPLPIDPLFVALIADTQDDRSKWSIQAFGRNGDQYFVDWGESLELTDLDDIARREIMTRSGVMPITVTLIDEGGHRSFEVRQHVYERWPACLSSRGSTGSVGSLVSLKDYRIHKEDKDSPTIPVIVYDDNTFKRDLYIRRIARFKAERAAAYNQARLWFPEKLESSFTQEFLREHYDPKTHKWNTPKGNDYADTAKMGIILWTWISPELLRADEEERRQNEGLEPAEPAVL